MEPVTFWQFLHLIGWTGMATSIPHKSKSRQLKKKTSKPRAARKSKVCSAPRPGQKCPECGKGKLDYDGLLQLCCPVCGYTASGGGFT